jgi:ubiquitin-conjugating enzyme E2 variant
MAGSSSGETIIVPRNFVLLAELEKVEKGNTDMTMSYGLVERDDISLSNWQCTILGPINTPVENRIISLLLHCGSNYPNQPPKVQFQSKINAKWVVSAPSPCHGPLISPPALWPRLGSLCAQKADPCRAHRLIFLAPRTTRPRPSYLTGLRWGCQSDGVVEACELGSSHVDRVGAERAQDGIPKAAQGPAA